MDSLINVVMVASIGVLIFIMMDYMHSMKKWKWRKVGAIMSPVLCIWFAMLYLVITLK